METLLEEAPALLISIIFIAGIVVLLALGVIQSTNPLVTAIFTGILTFWIGNGSSRATARQIHATLASTPQPPATQPQEEHV